MVTSCAHQLPLQAVLLAEDQEVGVVDMVHGVLSGQSDQLAIRDFVVAISPDIFGYACIVARVTTLSQMLNSSSQDVGGAPTHPKKCPEL